MALSSRVGNPATATQARSLGDGRQRLIQTRLQSVRWRPSSDCQRIGLHIGEDDQIRMGQATQDIEIMSNFQESSFADLTCAIPNSWFLPILI